MAEVYTVTVDSETPVEITGGRVGHFVVRGSIPGGSLWFGGPSMSTPDYQEEPEEPNSGYWQVPIENGFSKTSDDLHLYVTSPDEIFVVGNTRIKYDPAPWAPQYATLTIFHNR